MVDLINCFSPEVAVSLQGLLKMLRGNILNCPSVWGQNGWEPQVREVPPCPVSNWRTPCAMSILPEKHWASNHYSPSFSVSLSLQVEHWKYLKWCWTITFGVRVSHWALNSMSLAVESDLVMLGEDTHGTWVQSFSAGGIPGSERRNVPILFKSRCRAGSGFWLALDFPSCCPLLQGKKPVYCGHRPGLQHLHFPVLKMSAVPAAASGHCSAAGACGKWGSWCRQVLPCRSTRLLSQAGAGAWRGGKAVGLE